MARFKTRLKIFKGLPDMTSAINVVFLLLLFFMLSSSFVQMSGIKINLPETESESETGADKLIISIDRNNKMFFNDEQIGGKDKQEEWNNLAEKLAHFVKISRARTVIIVADRDSGYGEIVKLMTLARKNSLNVYAATVSPESRKEQMTEDVGTE